MKQWIAVSLLVACASAQAQQIGGALLTLSATGEVKAVNDQAHAMLTVEEQHADLAQASSAVNQKMKLAQEAVKRADPGAQLQTRGYYTYPVYAPDQPNRKRQQTAWRVGQTLEIITGNLSALPQTVAAAQRFAGLSHLYFGLSDAAARKLDEERIANTYRQLQQRLTATLKAMGKKLEDATIETIDLDNPQIVAPQAFSVAQAKSARNAEMDVAEPVFEAGETTLSMNAVARVRVK